jgi:hypothetical protein
MWMGCMGVRVVSAMCIGVTRCRLPASAWLTVHRYCKAARQDQVLKFAKSIVYDHIFIVSLKLFKQ